MVRAQAETYKNQQIYGLKPKLRLLGFTNENISALADCISILRALPQPCKDITWA